MIWKELAALNDPSSQRTGLWRIALTALVYCQFSVALWLGNIDLATVIDAVTGLAQYVLMVPLLLLLVAAHNPARAQRDSTLVTAVPSDSLRPNGIGAAGEASG